MEELTYGPNGGLIYAMEYLLDNVEWFQENIGEYDDDYLIIDCPGQVELYTHMNLMHSFAKYLGIHLISKLTFDQF
jgi:GTPase SAR1 family protein